MCPPVSKLHLSGAAEALCVVYRGSRFFGRLGPQTFDQKKGSLDEAPSVCCLSLSQTSSDEMLGVCPLLSI